MSNLTLEHQNPNQLIHLSREQCDAYDDNALVQQALQQVAYFECIYERYRIRLLAYARYIGIRSGSEAEDILQEAFIKVWRNLNRFDQKLKFSNWLFRIMHNEAISYLRKQRSFYEMKENATTELGNPGAGDTSENGLDMLNQVEKVSQILEQLVLKYREVLVLRFLENMSYEEISDVLKIPEGTVATRINRAKKAFREVVKKQSLQNSLS